jgi:hypothetical protein
MDLTLDLIAAMNTALNDAAVDLLIELDAQGHRNTGALEKSIKVDVKLEGRKIVGEVSGLDYIDYINRRTRHSRVAGAQVAGLFQWWKAKGLSDKDARSAAFATAVNQVKYGSPTPGAFRYTTNGKRTGAIQAAFGNVGADIGQQLATAANATITAAFTPQLNWELQRI